MHTKTHITIATSGGNLRVKKGDVFKVGDILVDTSTQEIDVFDAAQILDVKPADIFRYLTVTDGEFVEKGQTIAKKKGFLQKISLKAPVSAIFTIIDKTKGKVGLKRATQGRRVVAPYAGTVIEVRNDAVVVEVKGVAVPVSSGKGHHTTGVLTLFGDETTMLTMPIDVAGKIIAVKRAESDMLAKADTLGAAGFIVQTMELPEFMLPYVVVADFSALNRYNQKHMFLHGDEKLLLVL